MSENENLPVAVQMSSEAQAVTQWAIDMNKSVCEWLAYARIIGVSDPAEADKALQTASSILLEIEKHYQLQAQVIGGLTAVAQEALRERDEIRDERDRLHLDIVILESEIDDKVAAQVEEELDYITGNDSNTEQIIVEDLAEQILDRGYDDVRRETWQRTDDRLDQAKNLAEDMKAEGFEEKPDLYGLDH